MASINLIASAYSKSPVSKPGPSYNTLPRKNKAIAAFTVSLLYVLSTVTGSGQAVAKSWGVGWEKQANAVLLYFSAFTRMPTAVTVRKRIPHHPTKRMVSRNLCLATLATNLLREYESLSFNFHPLFSSYFNGCLNSVGTEANSISLTQGDTVTLRAVDHQHSNLGLAPPPRRL